MHWLRAFCFAVLALWLVPQVAALCANVDLCASDCPDDQSGPSCPPWCTACGCAPNAPRLLPTPAWLAEGPLSIPATAWWPEHPVNADPKLISIFHPPRG